MKFYFRHTAVLLLLTIGSMRPSAAYDIFDVANPPGADVTYVGDVVQNGLPLQMKQFKVDKPATEVLSFYKQRWTDTGNYRENVPFYIEKKAGEWLILSKMEDHYSVVVQVKESARLGHTEGFISVSDVSSKKEENEISLNFPRLVDSQLISSTESKDNGRLAITLMIINNYSVDENSNYYQSSMDEQGWSFMRGGVQDNVSMLHFVKDNQQCEIAVSQMDDGQTVIFANLVKNELR